MRFEKIDSLLRPINRFIKSESTAGFLLLGCAVAAVVVSNSGLAELYHRLWEYEVSISIGAYGMSKTLHYWIKDGLMAMFFFVIGLELKREIVGGELSSLRNAMLPLAAAVGGMVVPALVYFSFNPAGQASAGWGIPMATDIAFALGILSLLGSRVPLSLKIFLTALAIVDDLGAVLVIAFFYTSDISVLNLAVGAGFMAVLLAGNYLGVRNTWFYGIVGIAGLWLAFLLSGVHATVAGVLAALAIPARTKIDEAAFTAHLKKYTAEFEAIDPSTNHLLEPEQRHVVDKIKTLTREADTPLQQLEHALHPFVLYFIMPVFAFSNAGISLGGLGFDDVISPITIGVFLGLLVGKVLGVVSLSWLALKLKWATLPSDMAPVHLIGLGFLAGIGFTMSLFIGNLAFHSPQLILQAKIGIICASVISGIIGFLLLRKTLPRAAGN